jgi:hypothetical protein
MKPASARPNERKFSACRNAFGPGGLGNWAWAMMAKNEDYEEPVALAA